MKLSPSSPSFFLLLATTLAITYTTTTAFSPSLGNTHSHSTCLSARKKSDDDQKTPSESHSMEFCPALNEPTGGSVIRLGDADHMAVECILVRSSAVDVIVVDSVAALVPRAELEGGMSDQQMGLQARLMYKALRKITGSLSMSQCSIIFLNQLRSKVGVIYGSRWQFV
jgi:hypothetical protein